MAVLAREPDLIVADEVNFIAHALVVPTESAGAAGTLGRLGSGAGVVSANDAAANPSVRPEATRAVRATRRRGFMVVSFRWGTARGGPADTPYSRAQV